jgi:hypothetical protein
MSSDVTASSTFSATCSTEGGETISMAIDAAS